jgi:hypothetical protein
LKVKEFKRLEVWQILERGLLEELPEGVRVTVSGVPVDVLQRKVS